jgi:hypothetical protein
MGEFVSESVGVRLRRKISCCRHSWYPPFERREARGTHSLGRVDKIKGRATEGDLTRFLQVETNQPTSALI